MAGQGKQPTLSYENGLAACRDILKNVSNKDIALVLKAIAAEHNMIVRSAFAPSAPMQKRPDSPGSSSKTRAKVVPKPENKSPAVKKLQAELLAVQNRIRASKPAGGGILPPSEPLIVERDRLLAAILAAKSSFRSSTSAKGIGVDSITSYIVSTERSGATTSSSGASSSATPSAAAAAAAASPPQGDF